MLLIEPLSPTDYRRTPWKNGRGELVVIANEGGQNWQDMGVAWHFGRTAIVEEGPFSDYTHYERLQVVTRGAGLVLIAPDHEIDLRHAMHPRRYDGGLPIRTRLEEGPVEVVNLIAHQARFDINLHVVDAGTVVAAEPGRHVVYAPVDMARVEIDGVAHSLAEDHALSLRNDRTTKIAVTTGRVLIGSICDKR
jgi:environmental stress-induced protein Ves